MIVGIGTDLIEVERIERLAQKQPKFLKRIFSQNEIEYSFGKKNPYFHLAARFAAKEAFFKALGRRIGWKEISISNLPSGKPQLNLSSTKAMPFDRMHVSLTHLQSYASALVILEKDENQDSNHR
ncbi:MAG: holo-ACP synthase [Acidobacteriota bacterium]